MSQYNPVTWDDDDDFEDSQEGPSEDEYSQVDEVDTPAASPSLPPLPGLGGFPPAPPAPTYVDQDDETPFPAAEPAAPSAEVERLTVTQVDQYGNEVQSSIDISHEPLTEGEAREITNSIKATTNVLYVLIKRAHAGKAYLALGYSSFKDYVKQEFNYSRSYAYKLLDQANVIEAIEAAAPEGTEVYVGESIARSLKKSLPELAERISHETEGLDADESKSVIEDIISEHRDRQQAGRDETDEDFDDFTPGEYAGNGNGNYDGGDLPFPDDDDENDEDLDQFLSNGTDPAEFVKRLDSLYIILSGLKHSSEFTQNDNLDDLLPLIPSDRFADVDEQVVINVEWAIKLRDAWQQYRDEHKDDGEDLGDASFEEDGDEFYSQE